MSRTHESYVEHVPVQGSSDRSFGLIVGGILAAIGVVRWFWFDAALWSTALLVGAGSVLMLLGIVAPTSLATLNRLWTKLGLLLARVFNPVVMFLMFAVLFVPVGLAMRLRGRDALRLRPEGSATSLWIERRPAGPAPQGMVNQF